MLIKGAIWKSWPSGKYILKTIGEITAANCSYPWLVSSISCEASGRVFDKDGLVLAH